MNNWQTDDGVPSYLIEKGALNSSSVVIDIGANFGQEIDILLPIGCEIHSFEPHPVLYEALKDKYRDIPHLHLNEKAAWHTDEKRSFYFKRSIEDRNGSATLLKHKTNVDKDINVEVECVDIVRYIENLDTDIDWLKIDAEGAEYEILRALFKSGTYKKIKNLSYEDHYRKINNASWSDFKLAFLADFNDIILNEFECLRDDLAYHNLWTRKGQ